MKLFLAFLLLPFCLRAEDIYKIHRLSEQEIMQTYTSIMLDACHHADQFWKTSSFDPNAGFWGNGVADGNEGTRAIGGMVLTCGVFLKYSDGFDEADRKKYLEKTIQALRYVVATHRTGTQKCTDGKKWGDDEHSQWQSAMWMGRVGFGAWLIWDKLDAKLQKDVERVIASEVDRFLNENPSGRLADDTKAEDNGWNLTCITLAANMFPNHPHAAQWNQKALQFMMNTLSVPQDAKDKTMVDGKQVSAWVNGANLQPDFTLENHYFFHPSYVACSSYFLTESIMRYKLAGRPVPLAATHHLMDTWKMFQTIILPSGESAYPQGMDWELHGLPYTDLYASLGTYLKDPLAARLENTAVQYIRAWQVMRKGDLAGPGSTLGFTRHAISAELATHSYLAHKIFGQPVKELTASEAAAQVNGVHQHNFLQFILHRTNSKLVSFSWKNRIMGMIIPIGEGHDGNPDFTVPMPGGLVGSFELNPKGDVRAKVLDHKWQEIPGGFEMTGTLLLNGERLKQTVKMTSIGEKTVVWQDRVSALADVTVTKSQGVPVGIENDEITGGIRVLNHERGCIPFLFGKPQPPAIVPGTWANVDERFGAVTVEGGAMSYRQGSGYQPGISVCTDILCQSSLDYPKSFKKGEEVAHHVTIFLAEATSETTAAAARSFKIVDKSGGKVLRFTLPEGGESEISLL